MRFIRDFSRPTPAAVLKIIFAKVCLSTNIYLHNAGEARKFVKNRLP